MPIVVGGIVKGGVTDNTQTIRSGETEESTIREKGLLMLSHVKGNMDSMPSLGWGSCHTVYFERPKGEYDLKYVEVFGCRSEVPNNLHKNFILYILDEKQKPITRLLYPYETFELFVKKWVVLPVSVAEVPKKFGVALDFDSESLKNIGVGVEKTTGETHSKTGKPYQGFQPWQKGEEWMIRVYLEKVEKKN